MIFDCFQFFNELDLLLLRCEELKELNVTHVLVESHFTHSGKQKTLYFQENKEQFAKYKIIHLVADAPPTNDAWIRERHQRDSIKNVLLPIAQPEDLIIVSDADEIPRASAIKENLSNLEDVTYLIMDNFYYFLNCITEFQVWSPAFCFKYKYLPEKTLSDIRSTLPRESCIQDAGWHFGWMGGTQRIIDKLTAFAHIDLNTTRNRNPERIEKKVENLTGFFHDGDAKYHFIPIEYPVLPKYIVDNKQRFSSMIKENIAT